MRVTIRLNGTGKNPYIQYGLSCNPFPQIPIHGWGYVNNLLADLESNPIKDTNDLRNRLKGCSEEFIEGCCERFEKGKMVIFDITFPEK